MPKTEDAAAVAAREAAPAAQAAPQPFVIALVEIGRGEDGLFPKGAVFRPRDAAERATLGEAVREATEAERRIAAVG